MYRHINVDLPKYLYTCTAFVSVNFTKEVCKFEGRLIYTVMQFVVAVSAVDDDNEINYPVIC